MTIVAQFSWNDIASPEFGNTPARQAWRSAVAEIATKAHEKLPECNGRVDAAVKIVLAGDVELLADGTAKVASQSNGTTQYVVCNGHCDCKDFARAPHGFCKHRLSAAIAKRAQELTKAKLDAAPSGQATPAPADKSAAADEEGRLTLDLDPEVCARQLPEAPASVNCYITLAGRKVQVTLRDSDEQRLLVRLEALLQRFPAEAEPEGEQAMPEGWCRKHSAQMKLNHGKDGSTWYSHKTADGWCKGR